MYCNNCGKENPDGSKFCYSCGAAMFSAVEANENNNKKVKTKKKSKLLPVVFIGLLVVLIAIYFFTYSAAKKAAANMKEEKAEELIFLPSVTAVHDPQFIDYLKACQLFRSGDLTAARDIFMGFDSQYLLTENKISMMDLDIARENGKNGNYSEALRILSELSGKNNLDNLNVQEEILSVCKEALKKAVALFNKEKYEEAFAVLESTIDYDNSDEWYLVYYCSKSMADYDMSEKEADYLINHLDDETIDVKKAITYNELCFKMFMDGTWGYLNVKHEYMDHTFTYSFLGNSVKDTFPRSTKINDCVPKFIRGKLYLLPYEGANINESSLDKEFKIIDKDTVEMYSYTYPLTFEMFRM